MLDTNGLIVEHGIRPPNILFSEAKLSKLYGKEVAWSRFNNVVDAVYVSDERSQGCPLTADEVVKLNAPKICVRLASLGVNYEPLCFATQVTENARVSHAAMAFGSVSMDDAACDIFGEQLLEVLATAFATLHAVSAGRSKGVSAERLAKVWFIWRPPRGVKRKWRDDKSRAKFSREERSESPSPQRLSILDGSICRHFRHTTPHHKPP